MRCIDVPLAQTGHINKLSGDYLNNIQALDGFYTYAPSISAAAEAIADRKNTVFDRQSLVSSLIGQYAGYFVDGNNEKVEVNIKKLSEAGTFTVTAGHQLNIFTGPLYYVYKLVSIIRYAEELKEKFPGNHFVPVYWMATEDHDFEEINHAYIWGRKLTWDQSTKGAVGRLDPSSLAPLIAEIESIGNNSPNAAELVKLFGDAYLGHQTMAAATRFLVNGLFKGSGLVVIDGDDPLLKKALAPVMEKDIFENAFSIAVKRSISALGNGYKLPVSPREINFFYLNDGTRERIVHENGQYQTVDGSVKWSAPELKNTIHEHPEKFSPNVVLRPIYQELVLPNICYVGGNNEIAYWLELKKAFEVAGAFYPQLLVRDSALFVGQKAAKYIEAMKLVPEDFLLSLPELKSRFYDANDMEHASERDIANVLSQYETLHQDLQGLPADLAAAIVKQLNLHTKELRKWKNDIHQKQLELQEKSIAKIEKIYQVFNPEGEWQERHDNFVPFYLQYGPEWFEILKKAFNPLDAMLHIFVED